MDASTTINLTAAIASAIAAIAAAIATWRATQAAQDAAELTKEANLIAKKAAAESHKQIQESNRLANEAAKQAEAHALEAELRESMRDQRSIASNMQAWWVTENEGPNQRWGVLVSTTGPINSIFFDISIRVCIKETRETFRIATLPPGQYFISSTRDKYGNWGKIELVNTPSKFSPLPHAASHKVEEISFQDQIGERWVWTLGKGLGSVGSS